MKARSESLLSTKQITDRPKTTPTPHRGTQCCALCVSVPVYVCKYACAVCMNGPQMSLPDKQVLALMKTKNVFVT